MKARAMCIFALGLAGCGGEAREPAPAADPPPSVNTTNGRLAATNLDARIELLTQRMATRPEAAAELAELYLMRARYLGRTTGMSRALELAEAADLETAGGAMMAASVASARHRFDDALDRLDHARSLGADPTAVARAEESAVAALGRAEEVLAARRARVAERPSFGTHFDLAASAAAAGRFEEADRHYGAALDAYRDVSPFTAAAVYFAWGVMWSEAAGDAERGRALYTEAVARLPGFVTAQIHLAELEGPLEARARLERRPV